MTATGTRRRLVAILAADVAGYSRLMAADEAGTLARFNALRRDLLDPKFAQYAGRVVGTAGDSLLVEFASAVDAVQCAVEAQERLAAQNAAWPEDRHIAFRMGINLGDVIAEGDTIHGDGVNIAARLERLAQPGTVAVSRAIHDQVKGKLAFGFADLGDHTVKNIAEPVRAFRVDASRVSPAPAPAMASPPAASPSVAILPFTNMSGDAEQAYFSDGITEDIITELSRDHGLLVIARNSSFAFRGDAVDIAEVGRKLGARYVVEGSVRKAGKRVRITSQLIEAATGVHVWAERYDRDLEDVFAVQDEVTERIVWALSGKVTAAEIGRAKQRRRDHLDAYDLMLRGIELFHRFNRESIGDAVRYFEQAVAADPASARAHAWLARGYWYTSMIESDAAARERSARAARRATELGDSNGRAEAHLAAHQWLQRDFESAEANMEKAARLGPNSPDTLLLLAYMRTWQGRIDDARAIAERLRLLDPMAPKWVHELLAYIHYLRGDYAASLEAFRAWSNTGYYRGFANLAACLAQLGRTDEAQAAWRRCVEARPGFTIEDYRQGSPYRRADDLEHWLNGLRKAGIAP